MYKSIQDYCSVEYLHVDYEIMKVLRKNRWIKWNIYSFLS